MELLLWLLDFHGCNFLVFEVVRLFQFELESYIVLRSLKHPQANGLVERANRSLGEGIKARLEERSKDWLEELPHVLWAHRTMIKSSNGETPFSLTYGTEAVMPRTE
ncbi:reverse transcriptase domain-containing protein, partial [Tanacetum coccineum]